MRRYFLSSSFPFGSVTRTGRTFSIFLLLPLSAGALFLAGCAAITAPSPLASINRDALSGGVRGGQQAIVGATVTLVAPGLTGYGSLGTTIATATAPTDASGNFTLAQPYTCPANSGLVYLLATGGNAGAGTNPAISEAAIVGNCSALTAANYFVINEVTTVAAAYALAPFAAAGATSSIGTSTGNFQGLFNAAGAYNNLVNNATGAARVTADLTGIIPPTSEMNTLADIIAACINQGAGTVPAGTCSTLFTATTPSGGVAPTRTFQAALNIAKSPGTNVSTLFGLSAASPPFQPTLTSAPNDFSVALAFNGGAISYKGTIGVAIDLLGNAWLTTGNGGTATHVLTEIAPSGNYISGSTVAPATGFDSALLNFPIGIAIDQSGFVYVDNNLATDLLKFNPDATLKSTITATSFSGPNAVALDAGGNPWVANFGTALVTKIVGATGVEAANSPFSAGTQGVDIAIGPLAIWQSNSQSQYVWRIDATTFAVTKTQIGGSIGDVAIDHSNNAWLAVSGNGSIFEIADSGGYVNTPFGGYIVAGVSSQNVLVDGLGNVFSGAFVNAGNAMGRLVEYSNSATLLSPGMGYIGSGVISQVPSVPGGIAIDGSGNIWMAGGALASSGLPDYVTEIVGLAAPVVTPRAIATTNNTLGTRP